MADAQTDAQFRSMLSGYIDKGDHVDVVAPGTPNLEFAVRHGMGKLPVGYLVIKKDRVGDVYDGLTAANNEDLFLRSDVPDIALRLLIF